MGLGRTSPGRLPRDPGLALDALAAADAAVEEMDQECLETVMSLLWAWANAEGKLISHCVLLSKN